MYAWRAVVACVPFAVAFALEALGMKWLEARHLGLDGVVPLLQAWAPDVAWSAGVALAFGTTLALLPRWGRWLTLVVLGLVMAGSFATLAFGHSYFMVTGANLSWSGIRFFFTNLSDASTVVASEASASRLALAWGQAALVVILVGVPLIPAVRRWTERRPAWTLKRTALTAGGAAATLALALAVPRPAGPTVALSRCAPFDIGRDLLTDVTGLDDTLDAGAEAHAAAVEDLKVVAAPGGPRPNVVLIELESLGWKSSDLYKEHHGAAPNLAKLGRQGLIVQNMYAVVPHTTKSITSYVCGFDPYPDSAPKEATPGILPHRCLPHILATQGYRSAFFQPAANFEKRDILVGNMGFDTYRGLDDLPHEGFEKINYFGREEKMMLAPSFDWVDRHRDRPFLLMYMTLTTHHNYVTPQSFPKRHFDGITDPDQQNYLNAVRYLDAFLAEVIEGFRSRGLLDNTVFIVFGDHGEGFGEHGRRQHDLVIWDEGLRVGAAVLGPPALLGPPRRIQGDRSALDVVPTVADLLKLELRGDVEGSSLLRPVPPDRTLHHSCWARRRCLAERTGPVKTIYHYDLRPMEVYDTGADPDELHNLARTGPYDDAFLDARKEDLLRWVRTSEQVYKVWEDKLAQGVVLREDPHVGQPVHGRFDDAVEVVSAEVVPRSLRAGGDITVRTVFHCLRDLPSTTRLFMHVQHPSGFVNADHVPALGSYPPGRWEPGDYIVDEHRVHVPGSWRTGDLKVLVGFWDHRSKRRFQVHDADVPINDNRLQVATARVQEVRQAPRMTLEQRRQKIGQWIGMDPPVDLSTYEPLKAVFGGKLELVAVQRKRVDVKLAGTVELNYVFRAKEKLPGDWKLTVELVQPGGKAKIAADHVPIGGLYPPKDWRAGEFVVDEHRIHIDSHTTRPGHYEVWLGFRGHRGQVPVDTPLPADARGRVKIGDVHVAATE